MLCNKVVTVFCACLLVMAGGMPQNSDTASKEVTFGLPFLQFTNGGIRFNFGGYHAEAGLGGLLGGGRTGGGLHASAGTPWGAQAAAGLGGLLSGDNANTGGGLYARAGLGEGRPAAAAGLGGSLDGSGRSAIGGGLFAGATTGARGVSVSKETAGGVSAAGAAEGAAGVEVTRNAETNNEAKPSRGRTNIQIISRGGNKLDKTKQVTAEVIGTAEAPVQNDKPANKETRELDSPKLVPIASGGIFGSVSVNPVPVTATLEKVKIIGGDIGPIAPPVPPPLPLASNVNEIVQIDNRPSRVKIVYPKLVVRKRFWGPRKQIIYTTATEVEDAAAAAGADANTRRLTRRQADGSATNAAETTTVPTVNSGFFDDVFKIPVSTLNAVNQLLNNNSG